MTRDATIEALHKAATDGTLTTFRLPGSDLFLSLDATMMRQALAAWDDIPAQRRVNTLASVRRAMKSALKKAKRGRLDQAATDAFASDAALWLAHELRFSDGERHIIESPPASVFKSAAN